MSRIGKHPVTVPAGVDVTIDGLSVSAKGKLGTLSVDLTDDVSIRREDDLIIVEPRESSKKAKTMWATSRSRIANIVTGVNTGFTKTLEITGVGYRASVQGNDLVLNLGYSHEVRYPIPEGIKIACEKPTSVSISGADKQVVGQVASEIRAKRPPEPFKGKGVRYGDERILRKEGKKK